MSATSSRLPMRFPWSMSPGRMKSVLPFPMKTRCATRPPKRTDFLSCPSLWNNQRDASRRFFLLAMLNQLTLYELSAKLARRETSAREAMQACLDQVHRVEPRIHAFISCDDADALAQADAADRQRASGQDHPLLGVPIGIKDVIAVRNQPLSCGSKILGKFISPYDATVIEKLKATGAIVFGRLNMDEFAMGSSTENSAFGATRNPWDLARIPGGSSGGSAAAVAADECVAALGSDTGGSI